MPADPLSAAQGYLDVLATLNCRTNHETSFELRSIPRRGDVRASVDAYVRDPGGGLNGVEGVHVQVVPLPNWRSAVAAICHGWFFSFSNAVEEEVRAAVVERFLALLEGALGGEPVHAWTFTAQTADGWWLDLDGWDYAFEVQDHYLWLHLGVSD